MGDGGNEGYKGQMCFHNKFFKKVKRWLLDGGKKARV